MPSVAISMRSDLLDMHDVCYMSLRLAKVTGLFIWIPYGWLTVSKGMLEVQSRGKRDCRDCIAYLPAALIWPTVRLQENPICGRVTRRIGNLLPTSGCRAGSLSN